MQKAIRCDTDVVFTCAPQHILRRSRANRIVTDSFFIYHHTRLILA